MLNLQSPRWKELNQADGDAASIPKLLETFLAHPTDENGLLLDPDDLLYGSLCHQALTVYDATYAALPHIVNRANNLPPRQRLRLLVFAGAVEAARMLSADSPAIPEDLRSSYFKCLTIATDLAHTDLRDEWSVLEHRYLAGAFLALVGKQRLGQFISNLDMHGDPLEWGEDDAP